jgi:biopolymer transport protein ExbD
MLVKKKKRAGGEIPTASLPDIVFMLLLFFLVTTTIDMDKGLGLVLPEKGDSEVKVNPKNITNILVNASGKIALSHEGEIRLIDVRELKQIARQLLSTNDKMIFSVKTDSRTMYKVYVDVLDQLKQADATRISIVDPES